MFMVFKTWLAAFLVDRGLKAEKAQSLAEYALIVALIAVAAIIVLTNLGGAIKAKFSQIVDELNRANP